MNRRKLIIIGASVAVAAMVVSLGAFMLSAFDSDDDQAGPIINPSSSASTGPSEPAAPSATAAPSAGPSAAATAAPPPATVPGPGQSRIGWWQPRGTLTWQWQLKGKVNTAVPADVYDVDAFDATPAEVAKLHQANRKVICYVNAGAYEAFRPDKGRFPAAVQGKALDGWPDEKWLDIRRWDVLEPIMKARFNACKQKGFDGVEPDNVDGYANESGFPLTPDDQLTYNRRLADLAHSTGLAVGLKNNVEQAASLAPWFDYAVSEECAKFNECDRLRVFTAASKPVFHVEYDLAVEKFCATTKQLGFSSMRKNLDLDEWRQPC